MLPMKKALLLAGIAVLASGTPFVSSTAHACSVMAGWPPSPAALAAEQDLVFAGTVESIVQDKSVYGEYRITFAVAGEYKGDVGETVIVRAPGSSAACGYDDGYGTFEEGSAWVIYASGDTTDGFSTNAIGLNKKYESVDDALAALTAIGITSTVPTEDLWMGKRGASVTWLQEKLIKENLGGKAQALAAVGSTGYFGSLTKEALAEFQTARGITPAQGYFGTKTRAAFTQAPEAIIPPDGDITIEGTTTCLPPKDPSKPTILLCALGLLGTDGNYYALSYENSEDGMSVEGTVRVAGTFTRETHDTWNSAGTIAVEEVREIK